MPSDNDQPPDTSYILRVIGRFSAGHACPIAADMALTASHVSDLRPFDKDVPLWPYRFEGGGTTGVIESKAVQTAADLAIMHPLRQFERWYQRAGDAPVVGERLWLLAYDWRSRGRVYADRVLSGRLIRIVAGHLMLDDEVPVGASGSCLLNARGEVVGIVTWGQKTEDLREETVVVAVFGDWWAEPKREEAQQ